MSITSTLVGFNMSHQILSRLSGVKDNHNGQYMALCPAHHDTTASLGIKVEADGRILMNCLSHGCDKADIMSALGLTLADLFPEKLGNHKRVKVGKYRLSAQQTLDILSCHITRLQCITSDVKARRETTEEHMEALIAADDALARLRGIS